MKDHPVLVHNASRADIKPVQALWGRSFFARLQGFTFRKDLAKDEGLVLVESRDSRIDTSIHMLFVWTDLAVIWINSEQVVVDAILAKSWRPMYFPAKPARYTLEIHPKRLGDFQVGDKIHFEHEID